MTPQQPTQSTPPSEPNDEVIQATAERLLDREILCCQSFLIDTLLRQESIEGFTIDDLQNGYVERDTGESELHEIFEWWLVTTWLSEKLNAISQPILENDYGCWWGRTCTGQAIIMDGTLQQIARLIHRDD